MYCRKCGKEIKDNSKFCPYCGNKMLMAQSSPSAPAQSELNADTGTHSTAERKEPPTDKKKVASRPPVPAKPELNSDTGIHSTAERKEPPTDKKKVVSRPKWVIPVAVVSSVAVIGVAVYMGVKVMQKPAETAEQVTADIQKQEEKPVGSEEPVESVESAEPQEPEYPVDITLNEDEMKGITDLLTIMGNIDIMGDERFTKKKELDDDVVHLFVMQVIDRNISIRESRVIDVNSEGYDCDSEWTIPKDILDKYIKDSINYEEYKLGNWDTYSDGNVKLAVAGPNSVRFSKTPQISKVEQVSADEIEVWGTVNYVDDVDEILAYTAEFDVIMKKNPDSMWGGYTLIEIKSWGRQDAQNTTGATGDWKQAFINAINPKDAYKKTGGEYTESNIEENYDTYVAFKLWDMNKDGIPEVICTFGGWNSAGSGMLYAYNPQTNSVTENMLGGRSFTYSGEELCATGSIGGAGHSTVYTLNSDGELKEEFIYSWVDDAINEVTTYSRNGTEISKAEYQQYENTYTQPLEADLTYGGLIQEIQNYAQ